MTSQLIKSEKDCLEYSTKVFNAKLTESEFQKLSSFVFDNFGIKMPPVKRTMLQSRLHKRMRALDMDTFGEYISFLFSKEGQKNEVIPMIDVVSTNKTDFFREPVHFDYIEKSILPQLKNKDFKTNKFKVWSAGCSSGEEPYTISFILENFKNSNPDFDYYIFGTDISTDVLQKAKSAIYSEEKVGPVPIELRKNYLLRSKDPSKKIVRVIPKLRNKTNFMRLNFMDNVYDVKDKFDIIFCRNVLIYFERDVQEKVIQKLTRNLKSGGMFFLGHSESITKMDVQLEQIRPTVFIKT